MARIEKPEPGKLILSFIYSSIDALADSLKLAEKQFGPVEYETIDIECSSQDRYAEEMGGDLQRRFFSFEKRISRDSLPAIKKATAKIEPQFADMIGDHMFRAVNIDPCILSPENLVMASYRAYNHRPYLSNGVYADMQLIWSRGQYVRLPWTDDDFCHDETIDLLTRVRNEFELIDSPLQPSAG